MVIIIRILILIVTIVTLTKQLMMVITIPITIPVYESTPPGKPRRQRQQHTGHERTLHNNKTESHESSERFPNHRHRNLKSCREHIQKRGSACFATEYCVCNFSGSGVRVVWIYIYIYIYIYIHMLTLHTILDQYT